MLDLLAPVLLVLYCLAALVLLVYALNCFVMVFLSGRKWKEKTREDADLLERFGREKGDDALPPVTTQLPIFNEANVAERVIRAACAMDYPRDRHEIQVLDDSTDGTAEITRKLVREFREKGYRIERIARRDRKGYKAGALAEGLGRARGEFIAVFDADFVPGRDFLKKTVPFLVERERLGFVQTRWGHRNRFFSLLTRAQSIGIDGHFAVEQSARCWNGLFLNFNGTAGVWRKRAVRDAGGWQDDTLTEDMDLSYRAQLAGWEPHYLFDVVTPAELPTDINAFKIQQHRWAKGSIQTARKLLPGILSRKDIPLFKKVQAFLHMTHYAVNPLMVFMTLLALPLLFLAHRWFHPVIMAGLLFQMFVSLLGTNLLYVFSQRMAFRDWWKNLRFLPALMGLGVGMAVNNSRAVLEALLGKPSPFLRTPKLGEAAETREGAARWYRSGMSRLYGVELFLGAWSLAAFLKYLVLLKFLVGPILAINAIGYTSVGILTLSHEIRSRRRVGA